jgi:hypothetical protein
VPLPERTQEVGCAIDIAGFERRTQCRKALLPERRDLGSARLVRHGRCRRGVGTFRKQKPKLIR